MQTLKHRLLDDLGAAFDAGADLAREAPGLPDDAAGRIEQPAIGALQPFLVRHGFAVYCPADIKESVLHAAGPVAQLGASAVPTSLVTFFMVRVSTLI
jgi:hypothetical protein